MFKCVNIGLGRDIFDFYLLTFSGYGEGMVCVGFIWVFLGRKVEGVFSGLVRGLEVRSFVEKGWG